MSYLANVQELIEALKPRLKDYLVEMIGDDANQKFFACYVHDDDSPSMTYNPKTGNTTVHCFGCGAEHDIFAAAAHFENLSTSGPDWITTTLPTLAQRFNLNLSYKDVSAQDQARALLFKLHNDVAMILAKTDSSNVKDYLTLRGWSNEFLLMGSIDQQDLVNQLVTQGWALETIYAPLALASNSLFGLDKLTIVIKDYKGRPVGFIARTLTGNGPKYINSPTSVIYEKRDVLLGLDVALPYARKQGLYVVEGPGEVAAMHRVGIYNVAASCGTAFTSGHLAILKMLGIEKICLSLDWDNAGAEATKRVLKDEFKLVTGVNCFILTAPDDQVKDISEFLENQTDGEAFNALKKVPAFEWLLANTSSSSVDLCVELVPIIASEPTAIRRDILMKILSNHTGVSLSAIQDDVRALLDGRVREHNKRLAAAVEKYASVATSDPSSVTGALTQHQEDIEHIEKEYGTITFGPDYQLRRYDTHEQITLNNRPEASMNTFKLNRFTMFGEVLEHGLPWTRGALIYVGGRENSGKTATCIAIAMDVALSDPDAIVLMHFTDDSYDQVLPRLKTTVSSMILNSPITLDAANNPSDITSTEVRNNYDFASNVIRELLASSKLTIIDSADGPTLTTLERYMRDLKQRFPDKKLLVMQDNTHNLTDFGNLEQTARMVRISTLQKALAGKYACCLLATVEYRKYPVMDTSKMHLPSNEDIADSRALKYRANIIIHVYNDLSDRMDNATVFWLDKGQRRPRLLIIFGKNKITGFKNKLVMDLDPVTVTLQQEDPNKARLESIESEENDFSDFAYEVEI